MIENVYDGRERRRFPRFAEDFGVRMIDVDLKRIDAFPSDSPYYETHFVAASATGTNISEGGFAFESDTKPAASDVLGLELSLPQQKKHSASARAHSPHCEETAFRALGQVVWVTPLEEGFLVGVRFIDLNPRRSAVLQSLIAARDTTRPPSEPIRAANRDSLA